MRRFLITLLQTIGLMQRTPVRKTDQELAIIRMDQQEEWFKRMRPGLSTRHLLELRDLIEQMLPSNCRAPHIVALDLALCIVEGVRAKEDDSCIRTNGYWGDAQCVLAERIHSLLCMLEPVPKDREVVVEYPPRRAMT
jgi:hypothetical protein